MRFSVAFDLSCFIKGLPPLPTLGVVLCECTAGQGLDNIAKLLTMSPLLLEKYLDAAESILEGAFPSENARSVEVPGRDIRGNFNMSGDRVSFNGTPELTFTYRNKHRARPVIDLVCTNDRRVPLLLDLGQALLRDLVFGC